MIDRLLRAGAASAFVFASAGLAYGQFVGSEGVETGAAEVSGEQSQEAEEGARTLGPEYYGTEPMKFLSNNGEGYSLSKSLMGEDAPFDFGGWVQMGYTSRSTGQFNSIPSSVNNHETWIYAERVADGSEGFDWGFRFDGMYGIDADNTQAFGNRPGHWDFEHGWDRNGGYGFAIPQLYVELAYDDISLIGGHFYTLLGYEVVTAPDNFFFSHAFTMNNSEAFTHTGALLTYTGLDKFTFYGGWTAGWDTGFDQLNGGSNFLGGVSYEPIDEASITYITTAGNLGWLGDGYTHSIVIDTTPIPPLPGFNYVFQSDYVTTNKDVLGSGNAGYSTIGINQYFLYWIFDELGVGTRFEWWKANAVSYYETTVGVHMKPLPNLMIRPEFRWQWAPTADHNPARNVAGLPINEGAIFGIDMILTF